MWNISAASSQKRCKNIPLDKLLLNIKIRAQIKIATAVKMGKYLYWLSAGPKDASAPAIGLLMSDATAATANMLLVLLPI